MRSNGRIGKKSPTQQIQANECYSNCWFGAGWGAITWGDPGSIEFQTTNRPKPPIINHQLIPANLTKKSSPKRLSCPPPRWVQQTHPARHGNGRRSAVPRCLWVSRRSLGDVCRWYVPGSKPLIPPGKLTWNLKMNPWKRRFLLETIIFRFHVSFSFGGGGNGYINPYNWEISIPD